MVSTQRKSDPLKFIFRCRLSLFFCSIQCSHIMRGFLQGYPFITFLLIYMHNTEIKNMICRRGEDTQIQDYVLLWSPMLARVVFLSQQLCSRALFTWNETFTLNSFPGITISGSPHILYDFSFLLCLNMFLLPIRI